MVMYQLNYLVLITFLYFCIICPSNATFIRTNRNHLSNDLSEGHLAFESLNSPIAIDWISGLTFKQLNTTTLGIYSGHVYLKNIVSIPEKASKVLGGMASTMFVEYSTFNYPTLLTFFNTQKRGSYSPKLYLANNNGIVIVTVNELTNEVAFLRSVQLPSDSVHFYPSSLTSPFRIFVHQGRKSDNPYDDILVLNSDLCTLQKVEVFNHKNKTEHIPYQLLVDNEHGYLYLFPSLVKNNGTIGRILQLNNGTLFLKKTTFVDLSRFSLEHPFRLSVTLSSIQPKNAVKFLFLVERISNTLTTFNFFPDVRTANIPLDLFLEDGSTIVLPESAPTILNIHDELLHPSNIISLDSWSPALIGVSFVTIPLTNLAPMGRFRDTSPPTKDYVIVTFYVPDVPESICKSLIQDGDDEPNDSDVEFNQFTTYNRRLYFLRVIPIYGCNTIAGESYEVVLKSPIHVSNALIDPNTHCLYLSLVSKLPYNLLRLCHV